MRTIERLLTQYSESHQNKANVAIHAVAAQHLLCYFGAFIRHSRAGTACEGQCYVGPPYCAAHTLLLFFAFRPNRRCHDTAYHCVFFCYTIA